MIRRFSTSTVLGSQIRVRFAPSPTGNLHLGGLRTALYNRLIASKLAPDTGKFLLRIEDTDRTRFKAESLQDISTSLKWCGIKVDEGPVHQSDRLSLYKTHAEQLLKSGHAYQCFCTPERLDRVRQAQIKRGEVGMYDRHCRSLTEQQVKKKLEANTPFVIRMKIPLDSHFTEFQDLLHGHVKIYHKQLDDQVIMKADGWPTYHLANVVDDHLMEISHVVRGEEWLSSTPKHVLLYKYFGWQLPQFLHLPLLLNSDRSKLSKRSGDLGVSQLKDKGYLPQAIVNFASTLGWSVPDAHQNQPLSYDEILELFTVDRLTKANVVVDFQKLNNLNRMWIQRLSQSPDGLKFLTNHFHQKLETACDAQIDAAYLSNVIHAMRDRLTNFDDLVNCRYFFKGPEFSTKEAEALFSQLNQQLSSAQLSQMLSQFQAHMKAMNAWTPEHLSSILNQLPKETKLKKGQIMKAVRFAVTAWPHGAGLPETLHLLGSEQVEQRIQTFLRKL